MPIKTFIRKGKRFIARRDNKGRFIEVTKWRREFTKKEAATQFTKSGSIIIGRTIERLTNVREIRDRRLKIKPPKGQEFQISATIITDEGTFQARSMLTTNKNTALKEALFNVTRLAADYDNDDADKLLRKIRDGKLQVDFETVYYSKI